MAPQLITGAQYPRDGGGLLPHPPTRLEIHDFVKHEKFFSLYIQVLQIMYSEPTDHPFSWYQIGGIHGLPYDDWNGAPAPVVDGVTGGFCEHRTTLFPTWHRPYMAALEQALQHHAIQIAETYEVKRDDWIKAAQELRQPYWDWSLPKPNLPDEVIALDEVEITLPNGSPGKVPNPFIGYKFREKEAATFGFYDETPKTVRWPKLDILGVDSFDANIDKNIHKTDARLGPDVATNLAVLKERLEKSQTNDTRHLLLVVHDWQSTSTSAVPGVETVPAFTNSLEAIHISVHGGVGGHGHMGDPAAAGFDPIFFLHHCQVDRLLSLWAALHPGEWAPPDKVNKGLSPFWKTPDTFWTSAEITTHNTFNYTYPEFKDFEGTPEELKEHIRVIVDKLYPEQKPETSETVETPQAVETPQTVEAQAAEASQVVSKWTARIRCQQHEVDRSFAVHVFIQDQNGEPLLAGSGHFFVNSAQDRCANCVAQTKEGLVSQAFVHLDYTFHAIGLHEKADDEKVDHLTENLHWYVERLDGTRVELPSLQVTVMKTPIDYSQEGELPTAGQPEHFHEITKGRTG